MSATKCRIIWVNLGVSWNGSTTAALSNSSTTLATGIYASAHAPGRWSLSAPPVLIRSCCDTNCTVMDSAFSKATYLCIRGVECQGVVTRYTDAIVLHSDPVISISACVCCSQQRSPSSTSSLPDLDHSFHTRECPHSSRTRHCHFDAWEHREQHLQGTLQLGAVDVHFPQIIRHTGIRPRIHMLATSSEQFEPAAKNRFDKLIEDWGEHLQPVPLGAVR